MGYLLSKPSQKAPNPSKTPFLNPKSSTLDNSHPTSSSLSPPFHMNPSLPPFPPHTNPGNSLPLPLYHPSSPPTSPNSWSLQPNTNKTLDIQRPQNSIHMPTTSRTTRRQAERKAPDCSSKGGWVGVGEGPTKHNSTIKANATQKNNLVHKQQPKPKPNTENKTGEKKKTRKQEKKKQTKHEKQRGPQCHVIIPLHQRKRGSQFETHWIPHFHLLE